MSDTYTRSVISFSLKMGHLHLSNVILTFLTFQIQFYQIFLIPGNIWKELARIMYKGKSAKINL